jgi:predicted nucleic acid-binding protein
MKYVLDASVAACWVLRNPLQTKALKLRADFQQNIHELIAPSHFPGEIASALTKAERQ